MGVAALVVENEILEKYKARNPEEPEAEMVATLVRFRDIDPGADFILLSRTLPEIRKAVSTSLTSEEDVLKVVSRGGTIALKGAGSGVYLPLTELQKKRIREEAERLGLSEIQALQAALKEAVMIRFGPF